MRIITVVERNYQLGQFEVSYRDDTKTPHLCGNWFGEHAAAAKAMDLAIDSQEYVIFGSKKVLDCIPAHLHCRKF